jgi:Protein of unknown function (DUF3179)
MATRRTWLLGTVTLTALLLAACGTGSPAAPIATPPASETAEVAATAPPTTTSTQAPTPAPTFEGELTGAPIPALDRTAAELDEARLNLEGGTFPPLVDPAVLPASASLLDDDALVLGALQNGEARAYPLSMMTFHHVANDMLGGAPYLVTF